MGIFIDEPVMLAKKMSMETVGKCLGSLVCLCGRLFLGVLGVWAGFVVWPRRRGLCPPGSVSSLFLFYDQRRAERALRGCRISKEGRRPKDRSLDRYPLLRPGYIRTI